MSDIQKTRFIAANYGNLQGLKAVPLGLLLFGVVLWANGLSGRATLASLLLPILLALAMGVLLWAVHRFYRARYGRVESAGAQKRQEFALGIAGGAVGLGAFLADISFHLPLSLIGLVFAASVLVEYLRMRWRTAGHLLLLLTLAFAGIMLAASILPLLGAGGWWLRLGLRGQLFGVLVVAGILIVCYGLIEHWFFVRQLPEAEE